MMKSFTFRSVDRPGHEGVQIIVHAEQISDIGGLRVESKVEKCVQLTEAEALELLAWLRRWDLGWQS